MRIRVIWRIVPVHRRSRGGDPDEEPVHGPERSWIPAHGSEEPTIPRMASVLHGAVRCRGGRRLIGDAAIQLDQPLRAGGRESDSPGEERNQKKDKTPRPGRVGSKSGRKGSGRVVLMEIPDREDGSAFPDTDILLYVHTTQFSLSCEILPGKVQGGDGTGCSIPRSSTSSFTKPFHPDLHRQVPFTTGSDCICQGAPGDLEHVEHPLYRDPGSTGAAQPSDAGYLGCPG